MIYEQYGIIDIGSNTIRLVLYEQQNSGFYREIENTKVSARLRNYLVEGRLTEEGISVLLHTLEQFQESITYHKLQHVICVGTATIRQATNKEEITHLVKERTGIILRILSEYEEAYYGYLAVMNSTSFEEGITIDIGGGSTEITYFRNRQLIEYFSFPFGALSLKQQFVSGDIPTWDEQEKMSSFILGKMEQLPWLLEKQVPIIAIGGSARNMARVHQNIISYPISGVHLYEMKPNDIEVVHQFMSDLSFPEMQKLDGLAKDRADTILPAVEVFQSLLTVTKSSSFIISRRGLREGIFYEVNAKRYGLSYYPNVIEESFHMLAEKYAIDLNNVMYQIKTVTTLCDGLEKCNVVSFTSDELLSVRMAAKVYNIGVYIDEEASSQHTFYLLANKTIDGMMHKDKVKLALLASFKNKLSYKQYMESFDSWFSKEEQRKIRILGSLLQLAASLNVTKRNVVDQIHIEMIQEDIHIYILCNRNALAEQVQAEKQKKQVEKALKRNVELHFQVAASYL
ncbi:exopolyphosphatase [Ectobacillus sp. sgz5001026]|uniref:Ppx/GppA phosphatase family protein n=1 Tax=Ectobacillus sp. sgz5001026 TaxID=3242473 RepID=UPI0036D3E2DE